MRKFLLIFMSLVSLSTPSVVEIFCKYQHENWAIIERVYECKVTKDIGITTTDVIVDQVRGHHVDHGSVEAVKAVHIFGQKCHYFPDGIATLFKNLRGILIAYSGLKHITSENMKNLTKLQVIFFPNNDIEVLEKDLFKYNTQLEAVVMNHNKIKHVAYDFLKPLQKLKKIYLYKNTCVDLVAVNPNQMVELVDALIEYCPPLEVAEARKNVKSEVQLKLEAVNASIFDLDKRVTKKLDELSVKLDKLLGMKKSEN